MKKFIFLVLFIGMVGCGKPWIPIFTGDCIDNSVSAVVALREQGYETVLKVGGYKLRDGTHIYHSWVEYKDKKTGEWVKVNTEKCYNLEGLRWR